MKQPTLVLASGSPRRQELIQTFGVPYRIAVPDVDESMPAGTEPAQYVEQLSLRKANAACIQYGVQPSEWIIGSDTVVVVDGHILGKPRDDQHACEMLQQLSGRTHQVYSGVALVHGTVRLREEEQDRQYRQAASKERFGSHGQFQTYAKNGQWSSIVGHQVTHVKMRQLTETHIRAYVEKGESADKAGAYAIQGIGAAMIEEIAGDYWNVVGLPVSMLAAMMEAGGMDVLAQRRR